MPPSTRQPTPDEKNVRALLDRYACPVPYHEVRTRFLGNMVTPAMTTSPIVMVQGLWGGEFPRFESMEALNELIDVLINGLWNALTRHQKRTEPFRLVRIAVLPTREGLAQLSLTRRQELDGFIEGLFAGQEEIDLPRKATASIDILGELRAMIAGIHELALDQSKPAPSAEIEVTLKHIQQLTLNMEKELHAVVLDCTRVRRQTLREMGAPGHTLH